MTTTANNRFCKVCFDAGRPETEYTSHFVKDQPGGIIICPTLLNQACRICQKPGHTSSYCQDRPRREEPRREEHRRRDREEEPRRDRDDYRRDDYRREEPRREEPRREEYRCEEPRRPRIRLTLEAPALCTSKHAVIETKTETEIKTETAALPSIDILKVNLGTAKEWGEEDVNADQFANIFVCDPQKMCDEFLGSLTTDAEHAFIELCDDQSKLPWCCD